MTIQGHCIFALASIILAKRTGFSPALANTEWMIVILGCMLSCLIPDIDHPRSVISQRFKIISFWTTKIFKHRGYTHSLLSLFLYFQLLNQFLPLESTAYQGFRDSMIIGYASHLIADMLTPAGIPLFWPFSWRFCFPLLYSNSLLKEILVCVLFLIYALSVF
ncbi:MAG: hypothetical protein EU981_02925 [Candidatus Liberibacter ctenarytainae]|uniref:Membrane-bound metal-dependent hydrolase n=1 Tax=Candidatus Liberibacter ctenarytainae TaxID=2020335 RepID=A0A937DH25_9HYPH|nr:hypothetical protein [Candidatus Liberibacter ctenarytainae]